MPTISCLTGALLPITCAIHGLKHVQAAAQHCKHVRGGVEQMSALCAYEHCKRHGMEDLTMLASVVLCIRAVGKREPPWQQQATGK